MTEFKFSSEQEDIFGEFRKGGKQNVVIQAFAGCAKTTTMVAGIEYAPEKTILMCAFGKQNAQELKARVKNSYATCSTLNSAGNTIIRNRTGRYVPVDERRGRRLAQKAIIEWFGVKNPPSEAVTLTAKLAAAGKNINPFATEKDLVQIGLDFEFVPTNDELGDDEKRWTINDVAACACKAMELATEYDGSIDYDDQLFLPVRMGWVKAQYDLVVVDEYQDLNPTQLMLAEKLCRGRMFLVGDVFQAIYEFRGADAEFAASMAKRLNAKTMTLGTTYRCPKSVVAAAQELVPGYRAADSAPDGVLRGGSYEKMFEEASAGDFILSRKNAPLAKICLRLLRDGKRALIRGRKIGEGLVSVIKQRQAKTIPELLATLETWERNVVEGLIAQEASETKIELIQDQASTIRFLSEGLASVSELVTRVESLFSEATPGNSVVCSSVHRAKGLEAHRVFVLADTLYPGRRKDEEEVHIHYVAITRSKFELVMVRGTGEKKVEK